MVLVAIIPELREGESFAWFPLLFMSIFVLVGLVVLLATLHQLLALTNPRLRLIVSSQNLHPGDTFTISWECLGNVMKVTSITMEIEGRESATYTRGTDTVTETQVFATIPIIVLADHADMVAGKKAIVIPPRVVPTFRAQHNKLEWILVVKGDIPRWPDMHDTYDIVITPTRSSL
jgi:hypothetical protein